MILEKKPETSTLVDSLIGELQYIEPACKGTLRHCDFNYVYSSN